MKKKHIEEVCSITWVFSMVLIPVIVTLLQGYILYAQFVGIDFWHSKLFTCLLFALIVDVILCVVSLIMNEYFIRGSRGVRNGSCKRNGKGDHNRLRHKKGVPPDVGMDIDGSPCDENNGGIE